MTHGSWANFDRGKPQIQLEGYDRIKDAPDYNLQTTLSAYDGVSKLEDVIDHVNNAEEYDYIEEYIESLSPEERQQVLREPEEVDTGDCLKEFQGQEYGIRSVDIPGDIMAAENLRSSFENYDGEIVGSLVYGSSANGFSIGENMATEGDTRHSDVDVLVIFDDEFSAKKFLTPSYVEDGNEFIKHIAEAEIPGLEFEEEIHPIGYTTTQLVNKLSNARNGFVDEEEELITLKGAKGIGPDGAREKDKKYEEVIRDFWISGLARYNREKEEQFAEVLNEFRDGFQMIEAGQGELRTDLEFDDYYVDKYLKPGPGDEPSKRELLKKNEELAKRQREIKQMMERHPEAEYRVETVEGDEESEYAETRTEYHADEEVLEELGLEQEELERFGNLETSENRKEMNHSIEDFN